MAFLRYIIKSGIMKKNLLLILILFLVFPFAFSQTSDKQNIEHVIQSKVFEGERRVRVFLPESYFRDSSSTFVATYVLDAQSDQFWNMAKENIGYMVNSYITIPMIAIGIVSDNRGKEFSPPAHRLQQHLEEEVFPLIEKEYRVKLFRSIVGHSWGGAFIGTTLFGEKKDMFDAYIGISPSFGDEDNVIEKKADSMLQAGTIFKKYLYFSHGNVGRREMEFGGYVANVATLLEKYPNKTIAFTRKEFDETDHWSVVIPSFNHGLMSMSRNYFADQKVIEDLANKHEGNLIQQIDKFYAHQDSIFGFTVKPFAGYLNFVANDFRDLEKYKPALELYRWALEMEPASVKYRVNISDTYDKMGDKAMAKASFTKTLEMMEEQKDSLSESYYTNVSEWIREKLEGYEN